MVRGIILTHGTLGRVLLDSAETVLGKQPAVEALTNEGLSFEQIQEQVEARLDSEPCILFVDFCGGSPYVACAALRIKHPGAAVISGVNLPMLFSFFTKREKLTFPELVAAVESDGHRGIQRISE